MNAVIDDAQLVPAQFPYRLTAMAPSARKQTLFTGHSACYLKDVKKMIEND